MASGMIKSSTKFLRRGIHRCQPHSAAVAATHTTFLSSPAFQDLHPNPLLSISKQRTKFSQSRHMSTTFFENESEYHTVADETLEDIQDAVEIAVEDHDIGGNDTDEHPEVVYASGVLTMAFPPHGTWVLNKQTPNRQIWWSSPISGPRRYEYDPDSCDWIYTREAESGSDETLSKALMEEFQEIYGIELDL